MELLTVYNIIDFQWAFDSIHQDTLRQILRSYAVPPKFFLLIEKLYNHFESSVILSNESSEWFPVKSGILHGWIL